MSNPSRNPGPRWPLDFLASSGSGVRRRTRREGVVAQPPHRSSERALCSRQVDSRVCPGQLRSSLRHCCCEAAKRGCADGGEDRSGDPIASLPSVPSRATPPLGLGKGRVAGKATCHSRTNAAIASRADGPAASIRARTPRGAPPCHPFVDPGRISARIALATDQYGVLRRV
jgi:hypothetical protein